MQWTLKQIADALDLTFEGEDVLIQGITIDSRSAKYGDLFFALPGNQSDGHQYLQQAFQEGCHAAIVQQDHHADASIEAKCLGVPDPLLALQDLACTFRKSFKIPVLAITGSNGKTTTREMTAAVLEKKYQIARTLGNRNNHLGVPLSILSWTYDLELAILEMGTNHFGEIQKLCEIAQPTHGMITNIGKGHLEFFETLEGVARAKTEMLDALGDGTAILNGDDEYLRPYLSSVTNTVTFGFQEGCTYRAKSPSLNASACGSFYLNDMRIQLSVPGQHQMYNALAATVTGLLFDIGPEDIQTALQTFTAADKRMQVIRHQDMLIINDCYNANPSSLIAGLTTLHAMETIQRRIVVLGDMLELGDKSKSEHVNAGFLLAAQEVDACFGYGPQMKITVDVAKQSGVSEALHYDHHETLIHDLKSYLLPGDGILIKGSRSMQMEKVVEALVKA